MFKRILRSQHAKRVTQWTLFILVVPSTVAFLFVNWGNRSGAGPGGTAGELFGRPVPWERFQNEYHLARRNLQAQLNASPDSLEPMLRQQTWDRLMLAEEAQRRVRVTDADVARHIQSQAFFQDHGQFLPQRYYQFVRSVGFTPQAFEERVRDDVRIERLVESVKTPASVTDAEVASASLKDHERLQALLLPIDSSSFTTHARQALTAQDLRASYDAHQELFRLPATRVIEYLGMPLDEALPARTPITDEQLRAFYEDHQEEFKQADGSTPKYEEVRQDIRYRLQTEQARKRLTSLALDLEEDVQAGLRFVEIALSRHLLARRIGPVAREDTRLSGILTPPMREAVFDIALGQMTQVFNTPGGVFLLMPLEESPARVPPFDAVRSAVEERLVAERARALAQQHARQMREDILAKRQAGLSVEEAFRALTLTPQRPTPFTRHDPVGTLGSLSTVTEALFALRPGELAPVLDTPTGFLVAFVADRLPPDHPATPEDLATVREKLLSAKQNARLLEWLGSLRKHARLKSFLDQSQ